MNVCMADIEKSTVDYILQHGEKPRFLLLDTESYRKLTSTFTVKMKETLEIMDEEAKANICKIHCTDCKLDILCVDTNVEMYELVR